MEYSLGTFWMQPEDLSSGLKGFGETLMTYPLDKGLRFANASQEAQHEAKRLAADGWRCPTLREFRLLRELALLGVGKFWDNESTKGVPHWSCESAPKINIQRVFQISGSPETAVSLNWGEPGLKSRDLFGKYRLVKTIDN